MWTHGGLQLYYRKPFENIQGLGGLKLRTQLEQDKKLGILKIELWINVLIIIEGKLSLSCTLNGNNRNTR